MNWETFLIMIFGSGAVFSLIGEIFLYKIKRADTKNDELVKGINDVKESLKVSMRNEIVRRCKEAIVKGDITFDEREEVLELYEAYEKNLNGNSRATDYIKQVKILPLKEH